MRTFDTDVLSWVQMSTLHPHPHCASRKNFFEMLDHVSEVRTHAALMSNMRCAYNEQRTMNQILLVLAQAQRKFETLYGWV